MTCAIYGYLQARIKTQTHAIFEPTTRVIPVEGQCRRRCGWPSCDHLRACGRGLQRKGQIPCLGRAKATPASQLGERIRGGCEFPDSLFLPGELIKSPCRVRDSIGRHPSKREKWECREVLDKEARLPCGRRACRRAGLLWVYALTAAAALAPARRPNVSAVPSEMPATMTG